MKIELRDPARGGVYEESCEPLGDEFGDGIFSPPPLSPDQRRDVLAGIAGGHAPQKACRDAGVDPQTFVAALEDDAAFAVALGRLEAVRSLNVLSVTYQKALTGAAADRSLYLKFRPPPPAPDRDAETVAAPKRLEQMGEAELADAAGEDR